jgi:phage regulator Rha-like protein
MSKDFTVAGQIPLPAPFIESRIYVIRGQKVMLDSDLAEIYEVLTKNLNLAVRRNADRFPPDFMFQLTKAEVESLRLQFATSNEGRGGRRYLPYAFTEHGVAMLSAVLNSPRAVRMSILIVRAFVKLRELAADNKDLARKIEDIDAAQKQHAHTQELQTQALHRQSSILASVVQDIQKLKNPPITRAIGFVARSPRKK